jgi:hypothetical protein
VKNRFHDARNRNGRRRGDGFPVAAQFFDVPFQPPDLIRVFVTKFVNLRAQAIQPSKQRDDSDDEQEDENSQTLFLRRKGSV